MRHINLTSVTLVLAVALAVAGCKETKTDTAKTVDLQEVVEEVSFNTLLKKAESGDPQAQLELGTRYALGQGVQVENSEALKWWAKASEQNNTEALYYLGYAYRYGFDARYPWLSDIKIDEKKAISFFKKASDLNEPRSQYELGNLYFDGIAVKKNVSLAIQLFQKSSASGYEDAQNRLGDLYYFGTGVPKDVHRAFELYTKSANSGHSVAQFALGNMYEDGKGIPKDYKKALDLYQKAAIAGVADAQNNLGNLYHKGLGTPPDSVLAYAWFNVSATYGSNLAIKNRSIVERLLTSEELAEAQALSSEWQIGKPMIRRNDTTLNNPNSVNFKKVKTGTAFYVSKSGHVLTNHHVIEGCSEIRAPGLDKPLEVVSRDKSNDIALLKSNSAIKKFASISSSSTKLRQGDEIAVFGFPLNAILSSGGNLTPGVVSATTGFRNNTNQIQITAPIQPGSSGSAVLNLKGEVIGVVAMKLSDAKMSKATGSIGQNVNFAISAQTIRDFLDSNKVPYSSGTLNLMPKSVADLGDEARQWTTVLECWK